MGKTLVITPVKWNHKISLHIFYLKKMYNWFIKKIKFTKNSQNNEQKTQSQQYLIGFVEKFNERKEKSFFFNLI